MLDRRILSNPFDSDVVVDPGASALVDVPRIHESAFDLTGVAMSVSRAGRARGRFF